MMTFLYSIVHLSLFAAMVVSGRKYETHSACFYGQGTAKETRMPAWAKNNVMKCIPISETNFTHDNTISGSVKGGEWRFYHFAFEDFKAVNRKGGSKIRISASPCHGSISMYVKPGLNFNGEPMNQMFETVPGTEGLRTVNWPFPDNHTGFFKQGPEAHMMEDGWEYPGPMFEEMKWGFNSIEFGKENIVKTKVLHGSYFISIHGDEYRDNTDNCGSLEDGLESCCAATHTCFNNFTLSVSMEPHNSKEEEDLQKVSYPLPPPPPPPFFVKYKNKNKSDTCTANCHSNRSGLTICMCIPNLCFYSNRLKMINVKLQ